MSTSWCIHESLDLPGAGLVDSNVSERENVCPQHLEQLELPLLGSS